MSKKRVRKHLLDAIEDLEFSLLRFVSSKGANKDFQRMTPEEKEHCLQFLKLVQAHLEFYERWLMLSHLDNDPNGERLNILPSRCAAKIQAVKDFTETLRKRNDGNAEHSQRSQSVDIVPD